MSATNVGRATALGFGIESTWGTAVSRTNWVQIYSCTLQQRSVVEAVGVLEEFGQPDVARDHIVAKEVSGQIVMPLQYEAIGWWLALLMGEAPTTSGAGPYVHTYDRGAPFAESLTAEVVKGNSGRSEVFAGLKVTRGRLSIQPRQIVRLSLDCLGYNAAARNSAGSPSFSSDVRDLAVYPRHIDNVTSGEKAGEFTWNSSNWSFQSLEFDINNNLGPNGDVESDYYIAGIEQQGQGEIIIRAQLRAEGSTTDALLTAHLAGTESDLALTATGPGNFAMTITARNARITRFEDPISSPGRITCTVEFRAKPDASDGALTIAVTNDDATYSTN